MNSQSNTPSVSVVMRTNQSDWVVGESLTCLFMQTFKNFELTVVDYSSCDRTREIVRTFPCNRLMIQAHKHNPGAVLNSIVSRCQSEIVVFLNADALLVSPHSLNRLLSVFHDSSVGAAFGRQAPRPQANLNTMEDYRKVFPERGETPEWLPYSMVFAAMRKSVWNKHPFSCHTPGIEDVEWGLRAKQNGVPIEYVPGAVAVHSHGDAHISWKTKQYREGDADPFLVCDRHYASLLSTVTPYEKQKASRPNSPDLQSIIVPAPTVSGVGIDSAPGRTAFCMKDLNVN